jgi:hypothetical protein
LWASTKASSSINRYPVDSESRAIDPHTRIELNGSSCYVSPIIAVERGKATGAIPMDSKQFLRQIVVRTGVLMAFLGDSTFAGNCMPVRLQMWSEAITRMDAVCLVQCLSSSSANENGIRDVSVELVEVLKTPAGPFERVSVSISGVHGTWKRKPRSSLSESAQRTGAASSGTNRTKRLASHSPLSTSFFQLTHEVSGMSMAAQAR